MLQTSPHLQPAGCCRTVSSRCKTPHSLVSTPLAVRGCSESGTAVLLVVSFLYCQPQPIHKPNAAAPFCSPLGSPEMNCFPYESPQLLQLFQQGLRLCVGADGISRHSSHDRAHPFSVLLPQSAHKQIRTNTADASQSLLLIFYPISHCLAVEHISSCVGVFFFLFLCYFKHSPEILTKGDIIFRDS